MKRFFTPLLAGAAVALSVLVIGGAWERSQERTPTVEAAAEPVQLFQGCTNVALTWSAGTPIETVAAAVTPSGALEAIWQQAVVGDERRFLAWSPIAGAPNDYTATSSSLEAVFICMTAEGSIDRPSR
jgi:hypothetical protein